MRGVLTVALICLSVSLRGQDMGMITCNKDYTATLNFSDVIEFVVVGNNPENLNYELFQSDRVCVIRSGNEDAPETSITVKLNNGDVWYGVLQYGQDTRIFYDFAKHEKEKTAEIKTQKMVKEEVKDALLKQRLEQLMDDKPEYFTYGIRENSMQFIVSNIKNDDQYTYLKIIVDNKTGSEYNVDGIFFKYSEGKHKGFKKKEVKIEERIFPVVEPEVKVIKAYTKKELGFVIPLFTVGDRGNLEIQVRESQGTRNPVIEIKGKDMLKVKVFE